MLNLVYWIGHPTKLENLLKGLPHISIKKFAISCFTLLCCVSCFAQYQGQGIQSDFWSRVRYGGGLGLGFGNNSFTIAVAPSAIYLVNSQFATGLSLNFNYSEFDESTFRAIGGSIITLFNPIPSAQLSAEFEQTYVNREDNFLGESFEEKFWVPALYMGLGVGSRNVMVGMRYDVLFNTDKSIYANAWSPFVRFYF